MSKNLKLDQIDLNILRTIQRNAKMSYKDIAEKLKLSRTPIFERIKKMEHNGIIKEYVAVIDCEKIGIKEIIYCHIKLKEHESNMIKSFESLINKIPQIVECHHVTGEYDCILKVLVKDIKTYQNLVLSKLSEDNNVLSFHSHFTIGEVKNHINCDL